MGDTSFACGTRFRGIMDGRRAGLGSKAIGRKPSFSPSSETEDMRERWPSLYVLAGSVCASMEKCVSHIQVRFQPLSACEPTSTHLVRHGRNISLEVAHGRIFFRAQSPLRRRSASRCARVLVGGWRLHLRGEGALGSSTWWQ